MKIPDSVAEDSNQDDESKTDDDHVLSKEEFAYNLDEESPKNVVKRSWQADCLTDRDVKELHRIAKTSDSQKLKKGEGKESKTDPTKTSKKKNLEVVSSRAAKDGTSPAKPRATKDGTSPAKPRAKPVKDDPTTDKVMKWLLKGKASAAAGSGTDTAKGDRTKTSKKKNSS